MYGLLYYLIFHFIVHVAISEVEQGIVKATGSGVLEDLTFKISEGSDQN